MTPSQRRQTGIGSTLTYLMIDCGTLKPGMSRSEAASKIAELTTLGRTTTWKDVIAHWVGMVKDENADLAWAIVQGSVYAGFEA